MNLLRTIGAVALAATLAGCGTLGGPPHRGITVAYEDTDGTVKFRPLELHRVDLGTPDMADPIGYGIGGGREDGWWLR